MISKSQFFIDAFGKTYYGSNFSEENIERIFTNFIGRTVIGVGIRSVREDPCATDSLYFKFDNGNILFIANQTIDVGEDYSTIIVHPLIGAAEVAEATSRDWLKGALLEVDPFKLESIHLLVWDDESEYSEWGVIFNAKTDKPIHISSNDVVSISISAPFWNHPLKTYANFDSSRAVEVSAGWDHHFVKRKEVDIKSLPRPVLFNEIFKSTESPPTDG
jgi:hypothetical protein